MISSKTLAVIFASSARVAVLRVFMLDPLRTYYQRQLESATGMAIRGVQRELERLKEDIRPAVERFKRGGREGRDLDYKKVEGDVTQRLAAEGIVP